VNGKTIIKSGTDFRNFTHVELLLSAAPAAATVKTTRYDVTSSYEEDPAMQAIVDNYKGIVDAKLAKVSSIYSLLPLMGSFNPYNRLWALPLMIWMPSLRLRERGRPT